MRKPEKEKQQQERTIQNFNQPKLHANMLGCNSIQWLEAECGLWCSAGIQMGITGGSHSQCNSCVTCPNASSANVRAKSTMFQRKICACDRRSSQNRISTYLQMSPEKLTANQNGMYLVRQVKTSTGRTHVLSSRQIVAGNLVRTQAKSEELQMRVLQREQISTVTVQFYTTVKSALVKKLTWISTFQQTPVFSHNSNDNKTATTKT